MAPYLPKFTDEISGETGRVTGCVPASGLMGINRMTHDQYSNLAPEREALQSAMGTQDKGANYAQLAAGVKARYGLTIPYGQGSWATIAAALADPTKGVTLIGSYKYLPLALRQHGRQPTFDGIHSFYAQCLNPTEGTVTFGDPLATSYTTAKAADLKAYSDSYYNMYATFQEETMVLIPATAYERIVNKKSATIATPSNFRLDRYTSAEIIKPFPPGIVFYPIASANDGSPAGGSTPNLWYAGFLYSDRAPTGERFGWFHSVVLGPLVDVVVPGGSSAEDKATIADLTAKLSNATQQATVATGRITEIKAAKAAESQAEVSLAAAETALDATIAK